jgi:hypothetical protein
LQGVSLSFDYPVFLLCRVTHPPKHSARSILFAREPEGTKLALTPVCVNHFTAKPFRLLEESSMKKDQVQTQVQQQDKGISLETMIAVGVFGWLAIGMVMMGLGIW